MRKHEQVVCIGHGPWEQEQNFSIWQRLGLTSKETSLGPKFNEIVTIEIIKGDYFAFIEHPQILKGERCFYHRDEFSPLMSTFELEQELHEIFSV